MRKVLARTTLALFVSGAAAAGEISEASYTASLTRVNDAIKEVKFLKELCMQYYPNEDVVPAYRLWRKYFRPFLEEMEAALEERLLLDANGDAEFEGRLRKASADYDKTHKARFEREIEFAALSGRGFTLKGECGTYVLSVIGDQWNFEKRFAGDVALIRNFRAQKGRGNQ